MDTATIALPIVICAMVHGVISAYNVSLATIMMGMVVSHVILDVSSVMEVIKKIACVVTLERSSSLMGAVVLTALTYWCIQKKGNINTVVYRQELKVVVITIIKMVAAY